MKKIKSEKLGELLIYVEKEYFGRNSYFILVKVRHSHCRAVILGEARFEVSYDKNLNRKRLKQMMEKVVKIAEKNYDKMVNFVEARKNQNQLSRV